MAIDFSIDGGIAVITINRPEVAANAPLAVQASREMAIRAGDVDLATGLRMEQGMNRLLWSSDDVHEGVKAFAEKRPPNFQGK